MTTEDLFAALDIAPEDTGPVDMDDTPARQAEQSAPASPTALDLDAWSLRRGEEALQGDVLGPILTDGQYAVTAPDKLDAAAHTAADCLAAAFEPTPRLAERCADETKGRYFRQLMETEEYAALHADTRLDPVASELAAGHFAQGYTALCEQQEPEPPEGQQGGDTPPKTRDEQAREEMRKDMAALGAASTALQKATDEVEDLRGAQRAMGDGAGGNTRLPAAELKERFERVKNSAQLRRIMELAGRYRRLAQAKQRQKTLHGRDDMVGVEMGNDLGRLCPSELAALADEDLELDALRRYLERGLMQREYRGVEPVARGPIVVVVDESGSMAGEEIATAKAFALSMAWVARHQHRWICLAGFSQGPEGSILAMPPGAWDGAALLDWLEHFYGGGTSLDVPLKTIPDNWQALGCPEGKTDMIIVSDGIVSIPDDLRASFTAWKEREQVKLYTILLECGDVDGCDLSTVSDRIWNLENLDLENDAIQEVMSI